VGERLRDGAAVELLELLLLHDRGASSSSPHARNRRSLRLFPGRGQTVSGLMNTP
jgi:hypothetical protein